jgi:putative sigma-54 modulation protein
MVIQTQSVHFDADGKLLEFIQKKLVKLETYHDKILNADVILKLEKTGQVQDKVAEIKVNIPGSTLIAKETRKTFEESVDEAIDALRVQLIKVKEKYRA